MLGRPAAGAVHVGDDLDADVRGAASAGVRGVLLSRDGPAPPGVETIADLRALIA